MKIELQVERFYKGLCDAPLTGGGAAAVSHGYKFTMFGDISFDYLHFKMPTIPHLESLRFYIDFFYAALCM